MDRQFARQEVQIMNMKNNESIKVSGNFITSIDTLQHSNFYFQNSSYRNLNLC
jgi:hypothetical protein